MVSRGSVQKKLEFHPNSTANENHSNAQSRPSGFHWRRDYDRCANFLCTIAKRLTRNAPSAWWFCTFAYAFGFLPILRASLLANRSHPKQRNFLPIFYRLLPTPLHRKSGKGYFFVLDSPLRPPKSFVSVSIIFESLPLHFFPYSRCARRAPVPNARGSSSVRSHTPTPPHSSLTS